MKEFEVIVDWNDADYITNRCNITDEELKYFAPLFKAISDKGKHHNWVQEEREDECGTLNEMYPDLPEEMLENFNDKFIPSSGESWGWVHTIKSIKLLEVSVIEEFVGN